MRSEMKTRSFFKVARVATEGIVILVTLHLLAVVFGAALLRML